MNNRKQRLRLATIPEYLKAHPTITENQIRFALRNRDANGFHICVYFPVHGRRKALLDVERTTNYFSALVRA